MALKRTFINRGKKELEIGQLKPNGVYAVEHVLPVEVAAENGVSQAQWGIIQLNMTCQVRRHYNVTTPGMWCADELQLSGLHIWKATPMEMQFASSSEDALNYQSKYSVERCMNLSLQKRISYFEHNVWHKIAERIARLLR